VPGLALAAVAYGMKEPLRGATDTPEQRAADAAREAAIRDEPAGDEAGARRAAPIRAVLEAVLRALLEAGRGYGEVCRSPLYVFTVLGSAAETFALGALAYWGPQLLQLDKGLSEKGAGLTIGLVALVGGMLGTLAGGLLSDLLLKRTARAYPLVCAVA